MRETRCVYVKHSFALLSLAGLFWIGFPASAQSAQPRDQDTTVHEIGSFDSFLDGHPEIAEQLRKDPSLVNDQQFVKNHAALQQYLQQHPGVQEEISENASQFMHEERSFDRQETRKELTNFDRFLDSHPEIAEQLRKDPSLVNDKRFVKEHPALQEFFKQHGGAAQDLHQNPAAFMEEEQRFDQREDGRDRDRKRGQLASMDRFLDSHPEIAEQLRKNPSLVNNEEFVEKHPALQSYLQQHSGVREEFTENPNAFMQREQRFDQREDSSRGDGEFNEPRFHHVAQEREMANFGQFLNGHSEIAQQISKNPSLLSNEEYMESHPQLQEYLKAHPGVQEEARVNPQAFIQSMRQVTKPAPKTDAPHARLKQH